MSEALTSTVLLCRCGARHVVVEARELDEVMRPLPVRPLAGCPPPGLGETTVRGEAAMVLDLAALFVPAAHDPALIAAPSPRPSASATSARFLALPGGGRRFVLAVDQIVDVRRAFPEALAGLVRLADHPLPLSQVFEEGVRRALQAVRLVSDADWGRPGRGGE